MRPSQKLHATMRGGKAGTPGRRVVVVGGGAGRGGAPQGGGAKTLSDRFKALEKKGPKPGSVQRGAQNVQRTADKRFSKVCVCGLAVDGGLVVVPRRARPRTPPLA